MYLKHCSVQTGVPIFFNYVRRFRPLFLALLLFLLYVGFFEESCM